MMVPVRIGVLAAVALQVRGQTTDCLSIPNYAGKCLISKNPGACYIATGNESWQCWTPEQPADKRTDQACKDVNHTGACVYKDYGTHIADENLTSCFDVPGFSNQCPGTHWGACYTLEKDTPWLCMAQNDTEIARNKLDCKVTATVTGKAFVGTCTLGSNQTLYKCDTVKTYSADQAETACEGYPFACFSLRKSVHWQCAKEYENPSCRTTKVNSTSPWTYDGACVANTVNTSALYAVSLDASSLTTTTATTTTTTTTTLTSTTTTSAADTTAPVNGSTTSAAPASTTASGAASTAAPVATTTAKPNTTAAPKSGPNGLLIAGIIIGSLAIVLGGVLTAIHCRRAPAAHRPLEDGMELPEARA